MGNISFIIPKENLHDFNSKGIVEIISKNFSEIEIEQHLTGQMIFKRRGETICEMWNEKNGCCLLKDKVDESEIDDCDQANYAKLNDLNLSGEEPCIGISYGDMHLSKLRTQMLTILVKHFKGYWLDEGIHPEFISYNDAILSKYETSN